MNNALITKTVPHNLEAEESVIGSILLNQDLIVEAAEYLTSDDFYSRQNGMVFDAMIGLYQKQMPIDAITLSNKLQEMNASEEMSSPEFIRKILREVPTSANFSHYTKIVYEKSTLRKLIHVAEEIVSNCFAQQDDLDSILETTEKNIFKLVQTRNTQEYVPISDIVIDVLKNIEEAGRSQSGITGLSTGFVDLDQMTSGLQPSDLVLIAARPSMGKTAFALSLLEYTVLRKERPAAFFSLEMSREQLVNRLLSMETKIDAQDLRTGRLTNENWDRLHAVSESIGSTGLIIDDTPNLSITELRSKARKYKLEKDIQMIIVDYIQLMGTNGRSENRQQEVSDISRSLKGLARELNIPIVVLSQLNRAVENRQNKRPLLSDIRESGAIEQDADVIMFLYRDDYYYPDTEEKNVAEVIVAKQRNGPIGTIKLVWQPKYTRFVNILRQSD